MRVPEGSSKPPRVEGEAVKRAVLRKMEENLHDLEEAKHGNLKFRKDKGKIEVDLTTTK